MTHNLLIYPSTLPGQPLERYSAEGVTLEQWLRDNVPSYQSGDRQPISATVNGVVVEPAQWAETYIARDTIVELRPQPQGASLIVAAVVAAVAVAATILLRPSIPGQGNRRSTRVSSIYEANAEGNRPKLGDVIPEIAGRHKTYPDYLTAPRRYFVDSTTQALDLLLCVGRGEFTIPGDSIKIGSTPINSLGSDVEYQIFQPGESVTGHQAHANWYNAPEVGASVGSSGLRLKAGLNLTPAIDANALTLSGNQIIVPTGAGTIPADWEPGMLLEIRLLQEIDVIEGGQDENGVYLRDILEGSFPAFGPGDAISIRGGSAINGDYLVHSYTPGVDDDPDQLTLDNSDSTPAAFLPPGMYLGSLDYTGARYRIEDYVLEEYEVIEEECTTDPEGNRTCTDVVVLKTRRIGYVVTRLNPDGSDDTDWDGFETQTTSDVTVLLDSTTIDGDWAGPFLACPEGETTNRLEWDVFSPQGLGYIEDNGAISSRTRNVELQYRAVGSDTWTAVSQSVSGATRDQLGWTFTVDLPSAITPEVRVRRVGGEDTSTQSLDRLEWYGLRAKLPHKTRYPDVTVIAMTLIGSDTIASQTENQVSVVPTRRLPVRDNREWQPAQATRNIAPWIAYIAKSAGYTDDEIDFDELDRLDAVWRARGDYFDFVQDDDSTVKEALNRALRPGFAELTIDQGRIRPVRDEPRSTFEHMYTPQNMLGPLQRSVQAPRPDDPDGIDVEYFDDATWTTETVECRLPGDQGFRPEKLRIEGVTNRTRAWRIGMRERRRQKYRRWTYSFSTELDALNSRYMSYCALADDVPGYGQSAWLKAFDQEGDSLALLVSEPFERHEGQSHVIAWRRPDGTLAGPWPAEMGDDEFEVICEPDELPVIDRQQEPPHVLFGTASRWSYPALIVDVRPRGFESVEVEAVSYDERVYASDDAFPP